MYTKAHCARLPNSSPTSYSIMRQPNGIIHSITFEPNKSFDDPATPDGQLWNSALKFITNTEGWKEIKWGVRLEERETIDLLVCKSFL